MLRHARREDIPAMHAVRLAVRENVLTSAAVTEASYVSAIEETGRGWIVEVDGEVVGFAVGNRVTGNIWALFVDPAHEGRGHGRALHDAMLSWLTAQGVERAWLSTEPGTRAQRFYDRAGWTLQGILPNGEAAYEIACADAVGAAGASGYAARGGPARSAAAGPDDRAATTDPARSPMPSAPAVKHLQFVAMIAAPVATVWHHVISPESYERWTSAFAEGSRFEGRWVPGAKIRFLGPSGDGMVAEIAALREHQFISIRHLGFIVDGVEDTTSDAVKAWAPSYENYSFHALPDGTRMVVDQDVAAEWEAHMQDAWPKALALLKALSEASAGAAR